MAPGNVLGKSMNKMIVLWSHPRSMSTATERLMRERGDLWCAHEPFMYDYYVHRGVARMPHFDVQDNHPVHYEAIRDMLMARARTEPVFFKDMAYYVMPRILSDSEFLQRLTHVFLIRNPVAAILSYHKLDPGLTLEEVGIEAQWALFDALRRKNASPVVIEAEDVRRDPEGMMRRLWHAIDLPYRAEAFEWQAENPKDWAQVGAWHGKASTSTGILPEDKDEVARKDAEFAELTRAHPNLTAYLVHHAPFYRLLQKEALRP